MIRHVSAVCLAAALVIPAVAMSRSGNFERVPAKAHLRTNPMRANVQNLESGRELYRDHCAQCHRFDAQGDLHRPSLRTESIRKATDGDLEWFLREGNLRKGMPSWSSLPESQRWLIVDYLRSLP